MTNQQLATIHGISAQAVGRWSAERKRRAIIEAQASVNPEIKRLIGELAALCYVASNHVGELVWLNAGTLSFDITILGIRKKIAEGAPLNAIALQGAIAKLDELIYG